MCRFAAYLGPETALSSLVYDPPRSLEVQSYDPRDQLSGHVNVDGTGVAWWAGGEPMPLRYVTTSPPWSDPNLPALSRRLQGHAILAAVRSATPGIPVSPAHVHPFEHRTFAFAHHGFLERFREATGRPLLAALPDPLHAAMDAVSDSQALFMTVLRHLGDETSVEARRDALRAAVADALEAARRADAVATLNLALVSSDAIVATRCARGRAQDSMVVLERGARWPGATLVATEPLDDDGGWTRVPEDSITTVTRDGVRSEPLFAGAR